MLNPHHVLYVVFNSNCPIKFCCACTALLLSALLQCKHPGHLQLDYQQIRLHTNNTFVLQSRSNMLSLKGQMLPTTVQLPGKLTSFHQSCSQQDANVCFSVKCWGLSLWTV